MKTDERALIEDAVATGAVEVDDEGFSIRGLKTVTEGYSLLPLSVLFVLNFVDEFDRIAFATLISEIRDTFGMTDDSIQALAGVTGVMVLLAALPVGILADRVKRVNLAIIAGFMWGCAAVATGLVWAVPLLYLVRFLSGLGRTSNEVIHPSLLADYYPRKAHPQVYGIHRLANATAPVAGPAAGFIGSWLGWEAAFFILAAPTAFALFIAMRLREPHRGETMDESLAARAAGVDAQGFGEARRELFQVRTLRRLWFGAFFFGMGTLQLQNLISLYFERVFDFGSVGRGYVQFLLGAGTVIGLVVSSRASAEQVKVGNISRLPVITGLAFAPFAFGMVTLTATPVVGFALLGAFLIAVGNGGWQPAYFSIVGSVAPPRLRSQAYAWAVLIYGSGGLAYVGLLAAFPDTGGGYRSLTITLAIITGIAGVIGVSAAKFMDHDAANAILSLAAACGDAESAEAASNDPVLNPDQGSPNGSPPIDTAPAGERSAPPRRRRTEQLRARPPTDQ